MAVFSAQALTRATARRPLRGAHTGFRTLFPNGARSRADSGKNLRAGSMR